MILCVTLNPCLDKTLTVPAWRPGDNVRGRALRALVGGKGNNVARALTRLGRTCRPLTFLGGPVGTLCESSLRDDERLNPLVVPTAAETRVILTVRTEGTDDQTAFFDPDPAITAAEADGLLRLFETTLDGGEVQAVTLSGSSPSAATHTLYSRMISAARARRVPAFLDTYGPALDSVGDSWPDVVQLNRREAAIHLRRPDPSESDFTTLLDDWSRRGVSTAVVTNGPDPALVRVGHQTFRVTPPKITPVNPIGSGDSFLAGLVDATLNGLAPDPLIRHAFGCAISNALTWDAGAVDPAVAACQGAAVVIEPRGSV